MEIPQEQLRAEKAKRKREMAAQTKKIQEEAKARKENDKAIRQAAHQQRVEEAAENRARKAAERAEKHALVAAEQDLAVIEKKKREVTIEFSDFQSIKSALTTELQKYGTVENVRRTLSGCEARFSDVNGAQEAVAAGEVEATIYLTIQPAEIKQHSIYFSPAEDVEVTPAYLSKVKTFFNKKATGGSISIVSKKREAVVVCFDSANTRDRVFDNASINWAVSGNPIGEVALGFPMKNARKKQKTQN